MEIFELPVPAVKLGGSSAMVERRRRILYAARQMIVEDGLENFSVRELCERAGVAQRTIYYAFSSKENVIALAIKQYFDSFRKHAIGQELRISFEEAIQDHVTLVSRNLDIPNFIQAIAVLYFSPTVHPSIRKVLMGAGDYAYLNWLQSLLLTRQLESGVNIDRVAADISNLQYALVHEWRIGSITGEQFFDQSIDTVLLHLTGVVRGKSRQEVRAALLDWRKRGPGAQKLIAVSTERLKPLRGSDKSGDRRKVMDNTPDR